MLDDELRLWRDRTELPIELHGGPGVEAERPGGGAAVGRAGALTRPGQLSYVPPLGTTFTALPAATAYRRSWSTT